MAKSYRLAGIFCRVKLLVNERTRPDLDWRRNPRGFYVVRELLQSDAYRELTKIESDIILFILSRRIYPSSKKRQKKQHRMDYWHPINGHEMTVPYVAVKEFFNRPDMKCKPPSNATITRAIRKLMHVGFLSASHVGGNGKGDMTIYRLEHDWRIWKKGNPACFTKAGMSRGRGFCQPGSGVFDTTGQGEKLEKGFIPA